jgi:hypothetical protein
MNQNLMLDIINFYQSKEKISLIYYSKYYNLLEYEHFADKYWLISDILLYIKNNKYDKFEKVNNFYNINIKSKICIHNQLTYFWGIITPEERLHFIDKRLSKK